MSKRVRWYYVNIPIETAVFCAKSFPVLLDFVTFVGFVSTLGKQLERPDAIKSIEIPM